MITTTEFGEKVEFKHYSTVNHGLSTENDVIHSVLETIPEGGVFYDVGACMGLYSIIVKAHRPDVEVYAFEPHPENYVRLMENVSLNDLQIRTFNVAFMGTSGEVFIGDGRGPGSHKVVPSPQGESCMATTYQEFVNEVGLPSEPADVMKIDVEGEENHVLEGIDNNSDSPDDIFIEAHKPGSGQIQEEDYEDYLTDILDFFQRRGYNHGTISERANVEHIHASK